MELRLSLWENSKTFLEEAISKAVLAEGFHRLEIRSSSPCPGP